MQLEIFHMALPCGYIHMPWHTRRALQSSELRFNHLALTSTQTAHFGLQIRPLSSRFIDPVDQVISSLFR